MICRFDYEYHLGALVHSVQTSWLTGSELTGPTQVVMDRVGGGGGGFFLACEKFGSMFDHLFPACAFSKNYSEVEISSRAQFYSLC